MEYLRDFRVLRYDARGQGQSPDPPEYCTTDVWLKDLTQLLDQLNWPSSHFVGISNGGCVALAMAQRYSQRVRRIAVASCTAEVSALLDLKVRSWLEAHRIGGPQHRFDIATPWIWSNKLVQGQPELLDYYRERASEHSHAAVSGLLQSALNHRIQAAEITCPALLMCGEEDVLTPVWEMDAMCQQMQQAQLIRVPGAHGCLLEHPEIFADSIVPFLQVTPHVG